MTTNESWQRPHMKLLFISALAVKVLTVIVNIASCFSHIQKTEEVLYTSKASLFVMQIACVCGFKYLWRQDYTDWKIGTQVSPSLSRCRLYVYTGAIYMLVQAPYVHFFIFHLYLCPDATCTFVQMPPVHLSRCHLYVCQDVICTFVQIPPVQLLRQFNKG